MATAIVEPDSVTIVTLNNNLEIIAIAEADRVASPAPSSEDEDIDSIVTDIDKDDVNDPQAVIPYVTDCYENAREREILYSVTHNYMRNQREINDRMRYILIDWLTEVHLKFKLLPETMGLAVNLIDRYLTKYCIARDNLQLLGITCMFIAAKYEEIYPPECNDFVHISASAYSKQQILSMESLVLNTVEFNITVPTTLHFLRRYSKAAGSDYPTHTLCKYFSEIALVDMKMNKYYPSAIAAGCVYLARVVEGKSPWHANLEHYTQYKAEFAREVAILLLQVCKDMHVANWQAVIKKYKMKKFGEVASKTLPRSL